LLSTAFHPDSETNGFFFVYYTNNSGDNVVARYTATPPARAVPATTGGETLLLISHPTQTIHNGGQLQFGPDGNLYVSIGDGGPGGDPSNNAQSLQTLLGKVLRITPTLGNPPGYTIPAGNPLGDGAGPIREEIWHYGVRNPWRFIFDRSTGDLWLGNVGESSQEEVDHQSAGFGGLNFGWRRPEVSTRGPNLLDVFARGSDGAIWRRSWWGTGWSEWKSIGGYSTSSPGAVSVDSSRIDVTVRGGDGGLWRKSWTGSWPPVWSQP
jgi:hypothetical protein